MLHAHCPRLSQPHNKPAMQCLLLPLEVSVSAGNRVESMDFDLCVPVQDTLARDVLVGFPEHGFQLHFEPHCQRLRLVEVFDVTRLQVHVRIGVRAGEVCC